MTSIWIELKCPDHGLERFKVRIIKKYNIKPDEITPKFRTRPKYELSSIVVGRNVQYNQLTDYLVRYFEETGLKDRVLSIRLQV
ncbi:hypothetical protein KEJ45_00655 [Candidatus Bathyarchaeota archaeon]|nr:hypothetical protein [Candidatus Bathyarchaeota archaeon]